MLSCGGVAAAMLLSGGSRALAGEVAHAVALEKKKIKIGAKTVVVEVADTPERRERGLMFREHLAADTGMLFIFEREQRVAFWMKNTLIPLAIGYFGKDRVLREVHEMVPAVMGERAPRTYPSSTEVVYALEMPKGWFKRNGVKPGSSFVFVGQKPN
jgi:uncharacterized membrane protein (UPF0127 family)